MGVKARFFNNVCDDLGSDVGGGAIRKLDYLVAPGAGPARPAWVVSSTFGGGPGLGNSCANGGALSSIGRSAMGRTAARAVTAARSTTTATRSCSTSRAG